MRTNSPTKNEEIFLSIYHKAYKLCRNQSAEEHLYRHFLQQAYLLDQTSSEETRI